MPRSKHGRRRKGSGAALHEQQGAAHASRSSIVRRSLGGRRHKSPFAPARQALQNVRALHYGESDLMALGAVIGALHTQIQTAAVKWKPRAGQLVRTKCSDAGAFLKNNCKLCNTIVTGRCNHL